MAVRGRAVSAIALLAFDATDLAEDPAERVLNKRERHGPRRRRRAARPGRLIRTDVRTFATVDAMSVDETCDLLCLDLPKAERVRAASARGRRAGGWAAGAKALGDPTRLAIALALACRRARLRLRPRLDRRPRRAPRLPPRPAARRRPALARSERDGKMVMYELTERGRALLAAVARQEARA